MPEFPVQSIAIVTPYRSTCKSRLNLERSRLWKPVFSVKARASEKLLQCVIVPRNRRSLTGIERRCPRPAPSEADWPRSHFLVPAYSRRTRTSRVVAAGLSFVINNKTQASWKGIVVVAVLRGAVGRGDRVRPSLRSQVFRNRVISWMVLG